MLRITVTEYNGQPPEQPIAAEFDELGGKIGRANDNTLILPDPQRYISRTHAVVFFRAGGYCLRDMGSASPVLVNQRQLGTGQEAPIGHGDEIRIAGYCLRVADVQSTAEPILPADAAGSAAPGGAKDDPLAAFGASASASDSDPFANLFPAAQPPAAAARATPSASADARSSASQIPDDFDPFADPPAPSAEPAEQVQLPDGLGLGLGSTGQSQKIDELFGLSPSSDKDPFKIDTPIPESFGAGSGGASLDPLVALGMAPAAKAMSAQPQRDDTPEIYGSYRMPRATVDAPPRVPPSPRAPPPAERDRLPPAEARWTPDTGGRPASGAVDAKGAPSVDPLAYFSDPPRADARIPEAPLIPEPSPPAVRPAPPSDTGAARPAPDAQPPRAAAPPPATAGVEQGSNDELLRAFLSGAGVPDVHIPGGMTPQLMNMVGQMFREQTQGTLDLLLARAATKRQLRAEMTMIVAHENNPLKFSPSVDGALTHLLAPQGRGFMTPLRALRDAYNDLRSHEVGFLAGMRAALGGVLLRFSPAQLEKRLTRKSVLDSLMPMNREAKLWALFGELYAEISSEAEDNFHNLFGREFMRAYEDQIAKLEEAERKAKG